MVSSSAMTAHFPKDFLGNSTFRETKTCHDSWMSETRHFRDAYPATGAVSGLGIGRSAGNIATWANVGERMHRTRRPSGIESPKPNDLEAIMRKFLALGIVFTIGACAQADHD